MDSLAPRDRYYRHNDLAIRHEMRAKSPKDPEIDGYTHFHQMLIGNTSEAIPVVNGVPQLGTYQSVMVIELNQAVEPNQTLQRTIKLHLEGWRATGGDAATKPPEGN
jgi:thiamine phosphate synthase YjbQ (UPF0047 family)